MARGREMDMQSNGMVLCTVLYCIVSYCTVLRPLKPAGEGQQADKGAVTLAGAWIAATTIVTVLHSSPSRITRLFSAWRLSPIP